jgi:hypothetical protein
MDMIKTKKKILTHHHNLSRVFTLVMIELFNSKIVI